MPFACAYSDYNLVKFAASLCSNNDVLAFSSPEIFNEQTIDNELIAIVAVWGHISTANKLVPKAKVTARDRDNDREMGGRWEYGYGGPKAALTAARLLSSLCPDSSSISSSSFSCSCSSRPFGHSNVSRVSPS